MPSALQVDFWDVGFGDASVIWIDNNRVILIDSGPFNSGLPQWLDQTGIIVDLVVITHNDADHIEGLLSLIRKIDSRVKAIGLIQDRPIDDLWKKAWSELFAWDKGHPDCQLFSLLRPKNKPLDLLQRSQVPRNPFSDLLRLEVIYPSFANNIKDQKDNKSNYSSAIIVLRFYNIPIIVWPGDQQLRTCQEELQKNEISPIFLVGPHHGGPQDVREKELNINEVNELVEKIGHKRSWISVGWHERYRLPYPDYLTCNAQKEVNVKCSQHTPHCGEIDHHILEPPAYERFAIPKPRNKGFSCMGTMRVNFYKNNNEVLHDEEHKEAIKKLAHPLCI